MNYVMIRYIEVYNNNHRVGEYKNHRLQQERRGFIEEKCLILKYSTSKLLVELLYVIKKLIISINSNDHTSLYIKLKYIWKVYINNMSSFKTNIERYITCDGNRKMISKVNNAKEIVGTRWNIRITEWTVKERRFLSTKSEVNNNEEVIEKLSRLRGVLEEETRPLILDMIKEGKVWPTSDLNIKRKIKEYVKLLRFQLAIMAKINFDKKFSKKIKFNREGIIYDVINLMSEYKDYEELIVSYDKRTLVENTKDNSRVVDSERLDIKDSKWLNILDLAGKAMNSILLKVYIVDLISESDDRTIGGVDNKVFMKELVKTNDEVKIWGYFKDEIEKYKNILRLAENRTDQSIRRKGIDNLNEREKFKKWLKTKDGIELIKKYKSMLKDINKNPIEVYNSRLVLAKENNFQLKWELLGVLKISKLNKYKSGDIKRIYLDKSNGKVISLDILNLADRTVQMLLKLVMESYMEPLGDKHSFGYRPGRSAHMATNVLNSFLLYRTGSELKSESGGSKLLRRNNEFMKKSNSNKGKILNRYNESQYIINGGIKGCIDNISHSWLINHTPMPSGFEHLLPEVLKTRILINIKDIPREYIDINLKKSEDNNWMIIMDRHENVKGVSGIISPILMNWTLDDLEKTINESMKKVHSNNSDRYINYSKYQKIVNLIKESKVNMKLNRIKDRCEVRWDNLSWIVRYGDNFVVGVKAKKAVNIVLETVNEYLAKRGLELNLEKTSSLKWTMGNKVEYLGWTHQLLAPKKVNWMISSKPYTFRNRLDFIGLFTYPSKDETTKFRNKIKEITSIKNVYKSDLTILKELNTLIRVWSNNYNPAPRLSKLRGALDNYINRALKRWIYKKYQKAFFKNYARIYMKDSYNHEFKESPSIINGTKEYKLIKLWKLNGSGAWRIMHPVKELLENSFITDWVLYIKREIELENLKGDMNSKLFIESKNRYNISNELVDLEEYYWLEIENCILYKNSDKERFDNALEGNNLVVPLTKDMDPKSKN